MEKKFKVVRVGGMARTPTMEESEELTKINAELVEAVCANESELIEVTKDADVILARGVRITRRVMEMLPKCKAIILSSVGYDAVDVDAATDNGIIVVNNPASQWCVEEVSNHAITLLLTCAKKLVLLNNYIREDRWDETKKALAPMGSIYGQTLGLVGCGSIGRMVAKKAQCFSLRVLGYDPYVDKPLAKESGITLVSLPELLKESDFVSVHTFLSEETHHLIGDKEFRQMKPTAYFINTSRGLVVDELALIKALQGKWISGAGLDVFEKEPVDPDNPLLKMNNVVVTPHSAAYSDEAFSLKNCQAVPSAVRILNRRWPKNVVNKSVKPEDNKDRTNLYQFELMRPLGGSA